MTNNSSFPVRAKVASVSYLTTTAKKLFTLPPGAILLKFYVEVSTAFDDSGTDLLNLGIQSDDDYFATGVDVSSADVVEVSENHMGTRPSAVTQIYATYAGQNSDATAGVAKVIAVYVTPFNN